MQKHELLEALADYSDKAQIMIIFRGKLATTMHDFEVAEPDNENDAPQLCALIVEK